MQCRLAVGILIDEHSYDHEILPGSFHHRTAPTYQASRGTEASITAVPPPRGRVVQDSWIQATFLDQRLRSGGERPVDDLGVDEGAAGVMSSDHWSILSVPLSLCRTLRRIFLFDGDVSPLRNLNSLPGILEDLRDHLVFDEMLQLLARRVVS